LKAALGIYDKPKDTNIDYLGQFLKSREAMCVSPSTFKYYKGLLFKFAAAVDYLHATPQQISNFLTTIPPNQYGYGYRHTYFRVLKTFYRWLNAEYGIKYPMANLRAPILGKPIFPSLTQEQVLNLIEVALTVRDKAIIALLTESGLRVSELVSIKPESIDWQNHTVRIIGKGRKEGYAPFGKLSEQYMKEWLSQYQPDGNIWGMNREGVRTMLRRLRDQTGLQCNPHTFRRTFACLLRKSGIDTMTIKDLGRWESLEMVQRYTRSVSFNDSLKFYKAPLG
jgi:site-specific recombinase XerD